MALSVSMALSDLERNDFPQHKRLYNIGEEIVNQQLVAPPPPPPVAPRSRSSTLSSSNNSSRTSSPGPTGSRVGTPSPDITQEYPQWYPSQLSLRDFCMFKIDMAETSTQEKVKMLQVSSQFGTGHSLENLPLINSAIVCTYLFVVSTRPHSLKELVI